MAQIKLKAPDGYKLMDVRTETLHSEVVTDEKNRKYFKLVPDNEEQTIDYIIGG